jgi:hypothetical protein
VGVDGVTGEDVNIFCQGFGNVGWEDVGDGIHYDILYYSTAKMILITDSERSKQRYDPDKDGLVNITRTVRNRLNLKNHEVLSGILTKMV